MLCQACNQNEASIHYFESYNGSTKTLNLCAHCAERQGVVGLSFPLLDVKSVELKPAVQLELSLAASQADEPCVACGKTLADYRHDDTHACPACHDSFATKGQLRRRMGVSADPIEALSERLHKAVADEDFETAALLRDQIKQAVRSTARR